jgi:hypothetical protein
MDEETIERIKNNDPELKHVVINRFNLIGNFDYEAVGRCIGENTSIEHLVLESFDWISLLDAGTTTDWDKFFMVISRSSSIQRIGFMSCYVEGPVLNFSVHGA